MKFATVKTMSLRSSQCVTGSTTSHWRAVAVRKRSWHTEKSRECRARMLLAESAP